jgi:hypothetical protein
MNITPYVHRHTFSAMAGVIFDSARRLVFDRYSETFRRQQTLRASYPLNLAYSRSSGIISLSAIVLAPSVFERPLSSKEESILECKGAGYRDYDLHLL